MSLANFTALENDNAWNDFLVDSYKKAVAAHASSWTSWCKARFRKGNRLETTLGVSTQATGAMALAAGAAAGAGATVPSAFTVASAGAVAAGGAITLYALPATVTVAALAYWGYNKHKHHEVNQAIWKWWCDNCQESLKLDPDVTVDLDTAKEWLGWFGDEGISNMGQLSVKLQQAKKAYDDKFKEVDKQRRIVAQTIAGFKSCRFASRVEQEVKKNEVRSCLDSLASRYLAMGIELQYVRYRMERLLMYHQMLELTIRSIIEHSKFTLVTVTNSSRDFLSKHTNSYSDLWYGIRDLAVQI